MDLAPEEHEFLMIGGILREAISIPKRSPKTFYLITLTFIFPLSFAILPHPFFTQRLIDHLLTLFYETTTHQRLHTLLLLIIQLFGYLIFLFSFSLLSTAAVVFTVASLYTSKPVSFSSTISAVPKLFTRLFFTFLYVLLLMILYNSLLILDMIIKMYTPNTFFPIFATGIIFAVLSLVHLYTAALWHLASVVCVLEPVCGFAAMKKSYELLKGRVGLSNTLVGGYFILSGVITLVFDVLVVVYGGDTFGVFYRIVIGGFLVGLLVIVNLVGLLVQSLFYYVCKSYHHQEIDKVALHDHLGAYLGEYVPLIQSNIEMQNLDV